uniref:30S ribosomal protein S21 n=1 Tax=Globodera pallida TaxID=36090 RepID=A0A183CRL4_GLOPA
LILGIKQQLIDEPALRRRKAEYSARRRMLRKRPP